MMGAGAVGQAADRFTSFHWGRSPRRRLETTLPREPRALVELGRLEAVEYATSKVGDGPSIYRHKFTSRRPRLAVDVDGHQLFIVGGGYKVQPRGIVG
jgi:hypothetical protein